MDIAKALERPPECEQGFASVACHVLGLIKLAIACISIKNLLHQTHANTVFCRSRDLAPFNGYCLVDMLPCCPACCPLLPPFSCPPADILKFYGCELGAQTNFDKGTGTSIVNGAHDNKKLSELLEAFIKKYVQCYSCGNPETMMKIKKEFIYLKCKACGYVSDVDMRHKVNTFILKNPPENKLSKEERRCVTAAAAAVVLCMCMCMH